MSDSGKDHIFLDPKNFSEKSQYGYTGGRREPEIVPPQNRVSHVSGLRDQIKNITKEMVAAIKYQEESKSILDRGLIVEFESFDNIGEAFEEKKFGRDYELFNIRKKNKRTYATVFIPDGSIKYFENKITAYSEERKHSNRKLIDTIANFRKATIKALWTDTIPLPDNDSDIFCWEVWLATRENRQNQLNGFRALAKERNIEVSDSSFDFRERTVVLVRATMAQLEKSLDLLSNIAELRKAKTLANFFTDMSGREQREWLQDLQKRVKFFRETPNTPFICILDTGVNAEHPLIKGALSLNDSHTINDAWNKDDKVGHGTKVAGLALLGDLTEPLETSEQLEIKHKLESSKIINSDRYFPDKAKRQLELYANYTKQGVSNVEIPEPHRKRLFQMAVTTDDSRDKGKPSSWSAALDSLASGMDDDGFRRLFIISAGNFNNSKLSWAFPDDNLSEGIQDPGQAWNVLTIGAYTEKDMLSDFDKQENRKPTALHGEISPFTTASHTWENYWPLKPDIVMEGGNTAENQQGKFTAESLSLLTTNNKFLEKPFAPIWATSAASALASKMCAQIMEKYPSLRQETIRALMVHSATWTPAMLKQFDCENLREDKTNINKLVRICGFGVPSFTKALASKRNDFTMIIEDSLQPFRSNAGNPTYNEINFYSLPFPREELLRLGATEVEMRITLSYFVEPNPSRCRTHNSYRSHGLRFDVINPTEPENIFKGRKTKTLREDGLNYKNDTIGRWWTLGKNNRAKGSIHSDIWQGTAADLANCNIISVSPVGGWWKNKLKDKTIVNNIANYSLLVSIRTSADVDLLTPVEVKIANAIKTNVEIVGSQ